MGTFAPLEALYTAAPQDDQDDVVEQYEDRPDVEELMGEAGNGTLAPAFAPETFDAAILAGLVAP